MGDQVHHPYKHRDQYRRYQHDYRGLLQLRPRRPTHLFQQFPVRLPEICRDFVHCQIICGQRKALLTSLGRVRLARVLGFEPRLKVLETSVLPLYYTRVSKKLRAIPNSSGQLLVLQIYTKIPLFQA